jgi:ArsR family transcriptional regulator, arsenate/arsenite/antimonite-responsive transcriptional repressor
MKPVGRTAATTYAGWFQCLADPTRIVILNLLALKRKPMSVGEIVRSVDVGQPTVSHHLKVLQQTGFVLAEPRGASNFFRVNERCIERFPSAAELIMGRVPVAGAPRPCAPPWLESRGRAYPERSRPPARRRSRTRPESRMGR